MESVPESSSVPESPQGERERMLSDSRLLNNLLKTEKDSQKSCVVFCDSPHRPELMRESSGLDSINGRKTPPPPARL